MKEFILKKSENPEMEKILNQWFLKQRAQSLPVISDMLKQNHLELRTKCSTGFKSFNASDGWMQKFEWHYGARKLEISGEKISSQPVDWLNRSQNKVKEIINELDLRV